MDFQLALIFVVTLLSTQKIFPQCRYSRPETRKCRGTNFIGKRKFEAKMLLEDTKLAPEQNILLLRLLP